MTGDRLGDQVPDFGASFDPGGLAQAVEAAEFLFGIPLADCSLSQLGMLAPYIRARADRMAAQIVHVGRVKAEADACGCPVVVPRFTDGEYDAESVHVDHRPACQLTTRINRHPKENI